MGSDNIEKEPATPYLPQLVKVETYPQSKEVARRQKAHLAEI